VPLRGSELSGIPGQPNKEPNSKHSCYCSTARAVARKFVHTTRSSKIEANKSFVTLDQLYRGLF
jgi:hypothetical protein